ncbi:MAG: hypothetical protein GHCLOJNM_01557 [bacterium]|nr:hypothetical protein [bacterium]
MAVNLDDLREDVKGMKATLYGNGVPGLDEVVRNQSSQLSIILRWLQLLTVALVLQWLGIPLGEAVWAFIKGIR